MRYLLLILFAFVLSCANQKPKTEGINFSNSEKLSSYSDSNNDVLYLSKRGKDNIVNHLYKEAMNNDSQLKQLDNKMNNLEEFKKKKSGSYKEFINYNKLYYSSLSQYINQISDTTKRQKVQALMDKSRADFNNLITGHEQALAQTDQLILQLRDQHMLMQLLVSHNLITAYQADMPELQLIDDMNADYKALIKQTEVYTQL